jgi:hypothetical protein
MVIVLLNLACLCSQLQFEKAGSLAHSNYLQN